MTQPPVDFAGQPYDSSESTGFYAESFRAQYRMACQNCPDSIEKGDWIVQAYHDPQSRGKGYVHDECFA